jgi:DNA-binding response OmpR family regulator
VALTASVMTPDRAAAMAAGFTELLPKPCFPEDLAAAIDRIVAESAVKSAPHNQLRAGHRVVRRRRSDGRVHPPSAAAEFPR